MPTQQPTDAGKVARRASLSVSRRLSATVVQPDEAHAFASAFAAKAKSGSPSASASASATAAAAAPTCAQPQQTEPHHPLPSSASAQHASSHDLPPTKPSLPALETQSSAVEPSGTASAIRARRSTSLSLRSAASPTSPTIGHPSPPQIREATVLQGSEAPMPARNRQVGLGLILDEEETVGGPGDRQPASDGAHSGLTTAGDGPASMRAKEVIADLGWDSADFGVGERGANSSGSSSKPASLPRLSTTGGSPNPLLVYTGTPLTLSPRASPSSASPPQSIATSSLTQRTYPGPVSVPGSTSTLSTPVFSTPAIMRSPSPAPSYLSSFAMDRVSSSSKSREFHGRQQSLTSACPPVTASLGPPSPAGSNGGFYPPSTSVLASPAQRSWKAYDWGTKEKELNPSTVSSASSSSSSRDGVDGRKRHRPTGAPSLLAPSALLALPSTLLSYILAPLATNAPPYYHSPMLNGSTAPTQKSSPGGPAKRYPFPVRLLTISYLIFSILFFGLKLSTWTFDGGFGGPAGFVAGDDGKGRIAPRDALNAAHLEVGGDRFGRKVEGWAQKVAGGVRWGKALGYGSADDEEMLSQSEGEEKWATVKRIGEQAFAAKVPESNPLTGFSHTYRFAKMHDKIHWDLPDEIEPFVFRATTHTSAADTTACLYSNEAWLSTLSAFANAWRGPISLVFETSHSRTSPLRADLVSEIAALRANDAIVREYVDFHIVGAPVSLSERSLNKTRERLIFRPVAHNYHLNLARFFAPTDTVFLVGDARITPSVGLRTRLGTAAVRNLILTRGDAVVVPTFGFLREQSRGPDAALSKLPTIHDLRNELGLPLGGAWDGVGQDEFEALARHHVRALTSSLPLERTAWPTKKSALVSLVSTRVGTVDTPSSAVLALLDKGWDLNHGPTNWYLWRKSATDPRLLEPPDLGGGVGLGIEGGVGGGRDVFRVTDYDLHYAPNVVVSRKGQPWCTERFENMHAACVYQMYLAGAEMWVLPDEWAFTIEGTEKVAELSKEDPAQKLKNSISSRLYGKFHQEACMHYGREFLSVQMWDSDKAQHLRQVCARTLGTWGMGAAQ